MTSNDQVIPRFSPQNRMATEEASTKGSEDASSSLDAATATLSSLATIYGKDDPLVKRQRGIVDNLLSQIPDSSDDEAPPESVVSQRRSSARIRQQVTREGRVHYNRLGSDERDAIDNTLADNDSDEEPLVPPSLRKTRSRPAHAPSTPCQFPDVADEPEAPKNRIHGKTVNLSIGDDNGKFTVHQELLCETSPFFREYFESSPRAPHKFPDLDADLFGDLVDWVYQPKLSIFTKSASQHPKDISSTRQSILKAIKFYNLADEVGIIPLKDSIMTEIIQTYNDQMLFPTVEEYDAAYARGDPGEGLGYFMALSYQYMWLAHKDPEGDALGSTQRTLTTPELQQVLSGNEALLLQGVALLRGGVQMLVPGNLQDPRKIPICKYHEHEGGVCASGEKSVKGAVISPFTRKGGHFSPRPLKRQRSNSQPLDD